MKAALKKVLPAPWRAALRRWAYEPGFVLWRYTAGRGQRLQRPVFMIGSPRSGTTLAADLFGLHPEVANFSEAHEVWDPRRYRDLEADHHWTAADVTSEEAARLHARFEYTRRFLEKERFFNKNPRSSVRIDFIRAVFPDAVFLHVVRDGRAVAGSMLEFIRQRPHLEPAPMPFCRPPNWRELLRQDRLEQVALQWRAIVTFILGKRARLGAAYHEFKYEELCQDPRRVLAAAYRFAGLPVDDELWARVPANLEAQNYKWKTQFSPAQVELLNRLQGPLLAQLGYPL